MQTKFSTFLFIRNIFDVGYEQLKEKVSNILDLGDKTFIHNQSQVRKTLAKWGKSKIKSKSESEWNSSKRNLTFPKQLRAVA